MGIYSKDIMHDHSLQNFFLKNYVNTKKIKLIIIALIWILSLAILIIALTDLYPENIFKEHRFIIVIAFFTITGFLKPVYNSVINKERNFLQN
jgi:hypothetical protein